MTSSSTRSGAALRFERESRLHEALGETARGGERATALAASPDGDFLYVGTQHGRVLRCCVAK